MKTSKESLAIEDYFEYRGIGKNFYDSYNIPKYLLKEFDNNKDLSFLDIGCGLGQTLNKLNELGFSKIKGIDISEDAVNHCKTLGLCAEVITDINDYCFKELEKYDYIIMSHVLEHIPKIQVIKTLKNIKEYLLAPGGKFIVIVPNGQSNTDAYWAYEDFTHETLYTAGSLLYVLKAAGFSNVSFIDPLGIEGLSGLKKLIKKGLIKLYRFNKTFWNNVTNSTYHKPSPVIFTFELKAVAKA